LLRILYRIVAKALKVKSAAIVMTQLILNDKLCRELLPNLLNLIKHVTVDASSFANAPLVLPLISESVFILNKMYEGFKKLKVTAKSPPDIVANYKALVKVGEGLADTFLDKAMALFMVGDDCFRDKVEWLDSELDQSSGHSWKVSDIRAYKHDVSGEVRPFRFLRIFLHKILRYLPADHQRLLDSQRRCRDL
jgi:hypothetical protein